MPSLEGADTGGVRHWEFNTSISGRQDTYQYQGAQTEAVDEAGARGQGCESRRILSRERDAQESRSYVSEDDGFQGTKS